MPLNKFISSKKRNKPENAKQKETTTTTPVPKPIVKPTEYFRENNISKEITQRIIQKHVLKPVPIYLKNINE